MLIVASSSSRLSSPQAISALEDAAHIGLLLRLVPSTHAGERFGAVDVAW